MFIGEVIMALEKLKSFLDKGLATTMVGLKKAGQAATELGDKTSQQIQITQLNTKIADAYKEIGKLVFEKAENNDTLSLPSDIIELIDNIKKIKLEITEHEEAIERYKKAKEEERARAKEEENAKQEAAASEETTSASAEEATEETPVEEVSSDTTQEEQAK